MLRFRERQSSDQLHFVPFLEVELHQEHIVANQHLLQAALLPVSDLHRMVLHLCLQVILHPETRLILVAIYLEEDLLR